jgi:hypothetical protein
MEECAPTQGTVSMHDVAPQLGTSAIYDVDMSESDTEPETDNDGRISQINRDVSKEPARSDGDSDIETDFEGNGQVSDDSSVSEYEERRPKRMKAPSAGKFQRQSCRGTGSTLMLLFIVPVLGPLSQAPSVTIVGIDASQLGSQHGPSAMVIRGETTSGNHG